MNPIINNVGLKYHVLNEIMKYKTFDGHIAMYLLKVPEDYSNW